MGPEVGVIILFLLLLFALLGAWVAGIKGRGGTEGCLLGALFGPLGVIIEALLPAVVKPDPRMKPARDEVTAFNALPLIHDVARRSQTPTLITRLRGPDGLTYYEAIRAGKLGSAPPPPPAAPAIGKPARVDPSAAPKLRVKCASCGKTVVAKSDWAGAHWQMPGLDGAVKFPAAANA